MSFRSVAVFVWSRVRRQITGLPVSFSLVLVSITLAVLLWVGITNTENPIDTRNAFIRVDAVNVPRDYVVSRLQPERITVRLSGPANLLARVREDEIVVQVNLASVDTLAGAQAEFSIKRAVTVELRSRVNTRVRAEPAIEQEIEVQLERLDRTKPITVQAVRNGVLPVGYELESVSFASSAPTAVAIGAPRNVAVVEAIVAEVKLDGLTVSLDQTTVTLEARDAAGRTVGGVTIQPPSVTVSVKVHQTLFRKQMPVNVQWRGRPRTGYSVTSVRADPAFVEVNGTLDQINALSSILTDPVDVEGADRDVVRSVRLQLGGLPSSQQTVVVTITLQVVRAPGTIGVVPRVINVSPTLIATLSVPIVAVNLSGPLADLTQLRATDISVTVDGTGLGPGTHALEPKIVVPPTVQVDGVVPERVEVILTLRR